MIASAWEAGIKVFDDYEHESIEWGAVPGGWAVMACVELLRGKGFEPGLAASDAALEVGQDAGRWRGDGEPAGLASQEGYFAEQSAQTRILRDIFGNPFRPAPLDPAWLIPGVVELAQAIYDERAFGRLSVLADALEEAGCGDAAFLDHLRRPGPHVPGCWALDALLQKE